VQVIDGDAVEKGPLCQQIVVLFFGTVDDIGDDCEIEAWMVSPAPRPNDSTSPMQGGAAPLSTAKRAPLSSAKDDAYSAAIPICSFRAKEIMA
jgi:hypothetical protein